MRLSPAMHVGMVQAGMTQSTDKLDRALTSVKQREACGTKPSTQACCQVCILCFLAQFSTIKMLMQSASVSATDNVLHTTKPQSVLQDA